MELIEYAERSGQQQALFSLATLDGIRQRCHALLVLLLGGAGAAAVLALGSSGKPWLAVATAAVAVYWFGIAAYLAVRGLRTSPVRSWASRGTHVMAKAEAWQAYAADLVGEGAAPVDAMYKLRAQELEVMADAASGYIAASTQGAGALDRAYLLAAGTPLVVATALAVAYRFWG